MLTINNNDCFFDWIDEPLVDYIFSNIDSKGPTVHRRVEDTELFAKLAKVCKNWRERVFDPVMGPFKLPLKTLFRLCPAYPIPVEVFMGLLNQEIMRLSEASDPCFAYMEKFRNGLPAKFPKDADPNVLDYNGDTPYNIGILHRFKKVENHAKCDLLFEEFYAAGISDATLLKALPCMYVGRPPSDAWTNFFYIITIAGAILSRIKINGNERLFLQHLKPQSLEILLAQLTPWLHEYEVRFSENDRLNLLSDLKSICCEKEYMTFLRKSLKKQIPPHAKLEYEDPLISLIHFVSKRFKLPESLKSAFVQLVEKFPQEMDCTDKKEKGTTAISRTGTLAKIDLEPDCQRDLCEEYDNKIIDHLLHLKELYPKDGSFEKWLLQIDEERHNNSNLLHQIARWSPVLIDRMLELKLITNEMCESTNSFGGTVFQIRNEHNNSYFMFQLKKKPIIFDIFSNSYSSIGQKFHLLRKFLILMDPNITDSEGNTLLHAFFLTSYSDLGLKELLYLIDHGVDPSILNHKGESALDLARKIKKRYAYPHLS